MQLINFNTYPQLPYHQKSTYPPTKIKIFHPWEPSEEYMNQPINKTIRHVNNFITNIIKNKQMHMLSQGFIQ